MINKFTQLCAMTRLKSFGIDDSLIKWSKGDFINFEVESGSVGPFFQNSFMDIESLGQKVYKVVFHYGKIYIGWG